MSDLAIFLVAATVGLAGGLVCRRNNIRVLPNYADVDMGAIGKNSYYKGRYEYLEQKRLDAENAVPFGNRHLNHPTN